MCGLGQLGVHGGWLDRRRDCTGGVNGMGAWYIWVGCMYKVLDMGYVYGLGWAILGIWDGTGAYIAHLACPRCRYDMISLASVRQQIAPMI